MTTTNRNLYFQLIRGLCIIFVIIIHLPNAMNYNLNSLGYTFWLLERSLINCAVPVFFAISGYFFNIKKVNLQRLLIPFLIWSVVYICAGVLKGNGFEIKNVVKILTGQAAPQIYFVFVLLQINLLALILNVYKRAFATWVIGIITLIWYALYYIKLFSGFNIAIPFGFQDVFLSWIWYWYLGTAIKKHGTSILNSISKKTIIILSATAFVLQFCESRFLSGVLGSGVSIPISQLKFSNLIFSTLIILLVFRLDRPVTKGNLLTYIGDRSYGIYYIHWTFIIILSKLFLTQISDVHFILAQIFGLPLIVGVSLIVINLMQKVFGKKNAKKYLGF